MSQDTLSRLGSSWFRSLGRGGGLVRRSDRWEAVVMLLLVAIALVFVSVAGAVGTTVYDGRSRAYADEARTRHLVSAVSVGPTGATIERPRSVVEVPVEWSFRGETHSGVIELGRPVETGEHLEIWVDDGGRRAGAPRPMWLAVVDAVVVAAASWLGVVAVLGGVAVLSHVALDRRRARDWDRELRLLLENSG
ncbi:hypothetical protein A5752_15050 [Mycobacterium sp. 852002-51961_SCH5331710]|uniref:Rv1733c family protein n=1 Tax=Mycobacterium sp. E136 TaxID=1834125 RepID=UPI0008006D18|nr:hypothetical protein [Mycobacterium sp. E136]OBB37342.1 hypothetical protein A5752_15050 [Mycobacterium sp. 852002-51961_SCH5331710]OBH01794.1 hypothetical protein A5698_07405 [Mycobacterium sp. E136]